MSADTIIRVIQVLFLLWLVLMGFVFGPAIAGGNMFWNKAIEALENPVTYILLVNILALLWGVSSWKKTIREKWLSNLRDAGSDLIGAAELVHAHIMANGINLPPQTMSDFIAKEQKLLLLFAHNESEKRVFEGKSQQLIAAAQSQNSNTYRDELREFSNSISSRILQEWNAIK